MVLNGIRANDYICRSCHPKISTEMGRYRTWVTSLSIIVWWLYRATGNGTINKLGNMDNYAPHCKFTSSACSPCIFAAAAAIADDDGDGVRGFEL